MGVVGSIGHDSDWGFVGDRLLEIEQETGDVYAVWEFAAPPDWICGCTGMMDSHGNRGGHGIQPAVNEGVGEVGSALAVQVGKRALIGAR